MPRIFAGFLLYEGAFLLYEGAFLLYEGGKDQIL